MKNKLKAFLLTVCIVTTFHSMAQKEEAALVSVTYQFIHVYDTNDKANPIKADVMLLLGQTNSKYNLATIENSIKQMRKAQEKAAAGESSGAPSGQRIVVAGKPVASINAVSIDVLFQSTGDDKLIKMANVGRQSYIIEAPLPRIEWKIQSEDIKSIGGYICQKAVGTYGGRVYTAWFAPELPFRNGPWKLNGLPGLILEATDLKNEVSFLFKEIAKNNDDLIVANTSRSVKIDEASFDKGRKAYEEDPAAVMQSQLTNKSLVVETMFTDASGKLVRGDEAKEALKKFLKANNNPLELSKK